MREVTAIPADKTRPLWLGLNHRVLGKILVTLTERQTATLMVDASGISRPMGKPPTQLRRFPNRRPYRLYRLLSDLDDMVDAVKDDRDRLRIAAVLVRRFIEQADWLGDTLPMPDEEKGWAVHTLYQEPNYPFAIQTVSWLPGQPSPVHNHATWSIVAIIGDETSGRERNYLWRRTDDGSQAGRADLDLAEEQLLYPGDLIGFTPDAIHSVEQVHAEDSWLPTFTFNLYGKPNYSKRYEFDPEQHAVKNF